MKLHTSIARYIRRCGYALALTLAAGCYSYAATQSSTVKYLTDAIPQEIVNQAYQYTMDVDLTKPAIPVGTIVWDTKYITELYEAGNCAIRNWAPFRNSGGGGSSWDYGVVSPNINDHFVQDVYQNSTTVVKDATRGDIQNVVNRKLISYVGAASLRPWTEERAALKNVYKYEENLIFYDANGKEKKLQPIYGADGKTAYFYNNGSAEKLYDKDGNVISPTTETVYAGRNGDTIAGQRSYIVATDEKINVHHNNLIIDHSGFGLAAAAYSQYGDVHDNVLYIHDVRCSDDIIAAATFRGEAYNNTLVLARSEAIGHNVTAIAEKAGAYINKYNNSGKVLGAWVGSHTDDHAYNNRVFIYGASVYQDVTGAMGGGDMYNNSVFINLSNISTGLHDVAPSRAGYSTYGKAYGNIFVVDDTFDAIAAGLVEEDMSYYGEDALTQTSSVPLVSTLHDDVVGGASRRGTGDDAVHDNRVILKGITTTDEKTGEKHTTTVQSNIFGGVATNSYTVSTVPGIAGSANNNTVSITGVNILRDVTVSVLTDPDAMTWTDQQISINVGCITGGFAGALINMRWTPGNANDNVVIIRDSYFENSIYGGRNDAGWSVSEQDENGKEVGRGHANNNVVVLENLRTPVHEDQDVNNASTHDTTVYGGWTEHGKTNNNQVFISGTKNELDNTMLHGGWGRRAQLNDAGEILGKDGNVILPTAHYFDGTNFYTEAGTFAGSYRYSQLVKDGTTDYVRSEDRSYGFTGYFTGFDGHAFYDEDGNDASILTQPTLVVKQTTGAYRGWADHLRYTSEIKGEVSPTQELVNCDFYVEGCDTPVASFSNGRITKANGDVLLDNIASTEVLRSKDGVIERARFLDKDGKIIGVIGKFLAEREYEALKSDPPYHRIYRDNDMPVEFTGEYTENQDGTVTLTTESGDTYTFTNSAILDANDNVVTELAPTRHIYKDGTVLRLAGEAHSLFSTLEGYNEYDTYTRDNWLHVDGFQGKIEGFDHFEKLNFIFSDEINPDEPMLTLTGDQTSPDSETATHMLITPAPDADPVPMEVKADISAIADDLTPGDVLPLIGDNNHEKIEGLGQVPRDSVVDDEQTYKQGVTRSVTLETEFFEVDNTDGDDTNDADAKFENYGIIKVIRRTDEVTPESKALVEGRIATLTLNNMGGNLVAEQGIDSACRALEGGTPADANTYVPVAQDAKGSPVYAPKSELKPGNRLFFAMSGAHNKVDSGSDVDVDGTNALVGISRGFLAKRALTLGAFMETGWGKYHTHNHFGLGSDVPSVRGTGETSYVGAGALLRYHLEHLNKKLDGVSLDASVRIGRQETDYSTADLVDDYGTFARYEHESDYIAGHVGVNYTFQPTDKLSALVYARYLWTHVSNEEATVCGESVTFEDMHSNRVRLGGRLSWKATEKWTPYVGAAYEWEFSGTARANTHGMGITAPSMRGGSVIGEIGAVWQPNLNRALWIEGALQGSVGKNENYGARIGVSIGF